MDTPTKKRSGQYQEEEISSEHPSRDPSLSGSNIWSDETSQHSSFALAPICTFRRALEKDVPEIKTLVTETCHAIFGSEPVETKIKTCYLSMVAINADSRIIAIICLDDHPNIAALPKSEWETWIVNLYNLHNLTSQNTLFIHFIACQFAYTYTFCKPLLENVYLYFPYLTHILFVLPGDTPCFCFLEENFSCVMPVGYTNPKKVQTLYLSMRHHYMAKYKIRLAVEEDNDDIISIINNHSKRLKEMYGDYFVSEILTKFPNMKRNIIVAEVAERAVGVLFMNEEINYDTLIQCFNLEPFANLHNLDKDEVIIKTHSIQETVSVMDTDLYDTVSMKNTIRGTVGLDEMEMLMDNEILDLHMDNDDEFSMNEIIDLEKLGVLVDDHLIQESDMINYDDEDESEKDIDRIIGRRMTNSDIRFPMASQSVIEFEMPYRKASAFSLEVMAAEEEHEQGVICDMLEACFQSVTTAQKYYCVCGILSNIAHFPLCDYFVRAIPRRNQVYPREIYVLHKNSIKPTLKVQKMNRRQFGEVKIFLRNISYVSTLIDAITRSIYGAQRNLKTFIIKNLSVIIGIMVVKVENNIRPYFDHFHSSYFVDEVVHRYDRFGAIKYCIISPIFQKHIHFFLREVHRMTDMAILFCRLDKSELFQKTRTRPLPAILRDMMPVPKRRQPNFKHMDLDPELEVPSCLHGAIKESAYLFISTRRLCSLPRIEINSRVVVVGASCTALSFLESLIFQFDGTRHVVFNNLYLIYDRILKDSNNILKIVRNMFLYRGKYNAKHLNSMCFHAHVNYVSGIMTSINRKFKYITVNKEQIVPYDYLFLMCGQQFHQPYASGVRRDKICESAPRNVFVINKFSDAEHALNRMYNSAKHKRNPVVIVYGACLNTYACLAAFEKLNYANFQIKLVEPIPDEFERPSMDPFNNPDIYDTFQDILYLLGIEVFTGYYFYEWEVDMSHNLVKNVKYQSRKGAISFNCDFIFHYANLEVDFETFTAINNAGLVYDGKLVINPDCRTNDPFIFAAGPMTKYSRRYFADRFLHKYYNSHEIGEKLGKQVRAMLLPGGLAANPGDPIFDILKQTETNKLVPQYINALVLNSNLPSGINYLDIHSPGKPLPLETRRNIGYVFETGDLKRIELDDDPEYFRLQLDQNMVVEQIVCFTRKEIDVTHYQRLWGKHEKHLNNLVIRFNKGMITNLYQFFRNPYFCAIYIDSFSRLQSRLETVLTLLTHKKGQSIIEDIVQKFTKTNWRRLHPSQEEEISNKLQCSAYHIQMVNEVMQFLGQHADYFPMYAHPLITKIIIHDLESSPLFQSPVKSESASSESNK